MDPWDPQLDKRPYTGRRLARVTIPNPDVVDADAFTARIRGTRELAKRLGQDLFLDRRQVRNPCHFVLSRAEAVLPKAKRGAPQAEQSVAEGERLVTAAVILHQALIEFEALTSAAQEAGWVRGVEIRDYRRMTRGALRTMVQNLLMQAWARLPVELRRATMQMFFAEPVTEALWRTVCRGSLSVAYIARALQGIRITKRSRRSATVSVRCAADSAPHAGTLCQPSIQELYPSTGGVCAPATNLEPKQRLSRKIYWRVYAPTDKQDRWGKIDLIARGRVRGVGEVVLCINVKTGADHYLAVLDNPSEVDDVPLQRDQLEAFLEGVETFGKEHPRIARGKIKLFPAIIQTGGAVSGVTQMATNTKAIRKLVRTMLRTLAKELKAKRKKERDLREIDEPGLGTRQPRRTPIVPKT